MDIEATARVTLPDNKTGSVPDLTITDDSGEQQTLWDFTAYAPEHQTRIGAESLLAEFGWRRARDDSGREAAWQESGGRWTLRVETI
jgi:hypothetical protein